ncbi:MAG TPA: hypothetical protein VGS79_14825 [Puia sp.]|nr:hypothetical protein [Puia sp.]
MKKTIMWKGIYYQSLEYCEITSQTNSLPINRLNLRVDRPV